MNFIKRATAATIAAALALGLAACGGTGSSSTKSIVNFYATGSDNVRSVCEKLVEDFNTNSEYADTYQVKLNFLLSGTGAQNMRDMLVAAYKAEQTKSDFDVVDLNDTDMSVCLSEGGIGMFETLDKSLIPNAAGVSAQPVAGEEVFQSYRGTTVVLAYNSDTVANPPQTMDELVQWIQENPGRFAYNVPGTGGAGDSFARTAVYNLIADESALMSADEKWMNEWDAGFSFLQEIHPYMYSSGGSIIYPNKNQGTLDLLGNNEIDMCPAWADMVLSQRRAGALPESIKIATIQPSFTGSVQALAIPSFGSNSEGAHAFINYMLTPEAQKILVDDMAAIPLIDASDMDLTGVEDLATLDVSNFRTQSMGDLVTDFNKRWENEVGSVG